MTTTSSNPNQASNWIEETSLSATNSTNNHTSNMLTCRFNQDGGCLAIGSADGFSIYNLNTTTTSTTTGSGAQLSIQRSLQQGDDNTNNEEHQYVNNNTTTTTASSSSSSIVLVEMLFRCNLLALVKAEQPHRVLIWDDHAQKAIGELSFRQAVLNVKLRRDAIIVTLRDRVYVYHLSDLSLRDKIYTADNPNGLVSVSTTTTGSSTHGGGGGMILACPSVTEGHVRVELYGLRKTVLMEAHDSALRALSLTDDGTKLATASIKGTVIRVWQVANSTLLQEFRRGVERVSMTSLVWSQDHKHLACTSDKGTAHVFKVLINNTNSPHKRATLTQSVWSAVKKSLVDPSATSDADTTLSKSIAQIRGIVHPTACAFVADQQSRLLAICGHDVDGNGVFLTADYTTKPEATRKSYHVLCKRVSDDDDENNALSQGARRRKRLLGGTPPPPSTLQSDGLYIGERIEVLENQLRKIEFEEDGETGFLNVSGFNNAKQQADKEQAPSGNNGGEHNKETAAATTPAAPETTQ